MERIHETFYMQNFQDPGAQKFVYSSLEKKGKKSPVVYFFCSMEPLKNI